MKPTGSKTSILNFFRVLLRNKLAEAVLVPLTTNKRWTHWLARIPANYYQYPKGSIRNVTREGFALRLDISDYMQWLLYFGIETEPRQALYELIQPGMTILDVGANIGETSLMFSRLTGKNGQVFAFEPDPDTFAHLKEHLSINHVDNVNPIQFALGDVPGTFFLGHNANNTAGNRISDEHGKEITVTTADQFVPGLHLAHIHFIKIDIEGFEVRMLKGAKDTIEKYKPVMFIEAVNEFLTLQGSSTAELLRLLESMNYKSINAYNGKPVNSGMSFTNTHFDIIAKPE